MKLKRCENGHFYDQDKFAACPHCAAIEEGIDDENQTSDEKTVSLYQESQKERVSTEPDREKVPTQMDEDDSVTISSNPIEPEPEIVRPEPPKPEPRVKKQTKAPVQENVFRERRVEPEDYDDDPVTVGIFGTADEPRPVVGWLVCIKGSMYGQSFPLHTGKNFVGRGSDMDVIIRGDQSVSRDKHAIILYEPRKREFIAQAGESRELFYLNDEVVLSMNPLKIHDVLTIGRTDLMFIPFCGKEISWDDFGEVER